MMNDFNFNSERAKEARLGRKLTKKPVIIATILLAILVFCAGVFALTSKIPAGWLLIGLTSILLIILGWTELELKKVPVGKGQNINDLLSTNVMANLPKNPTLTDIVAMLKNTRSGMFIGLRYGITPDILTGIAHSSTAQMADVFNMAREIYAKVGGETISGGMLIVALIELYPDHENLLRQKKLEMSDLYNGLTWYNYLHGLVKDAKKHKRTGGIARDLSFGYIPTLSRFGQNISVQREGAVKTQIHLAGHKEIIGKMIQTFLSGGRQNIALVGPAGSGRTTIVNAFAEDLLDADSKIPSSLKFRQVFMLDAAAMISAVNGRGGLEKLVQVVLSEAYAAKNIIIFLDNAHLFFEDGTGSIDISNVLLPIIEAGKLRMILTIDQQKFLEISERNPALSNALNKIMVQPANEAETMRVMADQVPQLEYKYNVIYTIWALKEAYALSERYIHDLEMPGRALNLLESAANFAEAGAFVTDKSVKAAIEKTQGVKVQLANNAEDKQKLLNLEELIHERMVDQAAAVKTVSDALRRAAAGVRTQNRPIGTFLFLGPTGVGKTELAKAVSAVYFGGEAEVVRIDLNEYVTASDVNRLIAEASEDAMSLAAQVTKKPFSVVLLDEIEKAHPQVLTTLLQVLDEGILRDTKNHGISFRDAIIIATSNAGAERIHEWVGEGRDLQAMQKELTDEMIKAGSFKPEFLNRFDEICVFQPLAKEDLMKVVGLMIDSVNKTLEAQKIHVALTEEAKALLVEKGNDPQLGARPMRRIVQKTVENLVAKAMLAGKIGNGAVVEITAPQIAEQLE